MDELITFLVAGLAGFVLGMAIAFDTNTYQAGFEALRKCEDPLPRNQHCVLIAVPEGE